MKSIAILSLSILLSSCFSTIMDDDYQEINPTLKPYLQSFMDEAAKNGVNIAEFNTSNLKLVFAEIPGAAGLTKYEINSVMIDSTSKDWHNRPEQLVFHELGHLFLHRDHDNSDFGNHIKYPKSIMASVADPDYERPSTNYRREYYLKELFNENTSIPNW